MSFFTAGSQEKDTKNSASGNFFSPSYFETALDDKSKESHFIVPSASTALISALQILFVFVNCDLYKNLVQH